MYQVEVCLNPTLLLNPTSRLPAAAGLAFKQAESG